MKMEIQWEENGMQRKDNARVFSSWKGEGRFDWYPVLANKIRCKFGTGDNQIRDSNGIIVGKITMEGRKRVAKMLPVEELISLGATVVVGDD